MSKDDGQLMAKELLSSNFKKDFTWEDVDQKFINAIKKYN
jgi:hypothetical protein